MKDVKIDPSNSLPLFEQVAAEIRRAIADGEARPGERMPLAKDLATVLGVNTNTVLRALRLLREEGLLEFRRGRGITVAGTPQRGAVLAKVNELVKFARQQGYRPDELISMIESYDLGRLVSLLQSRLGGAPAAAPTIHPLRLQVGERGRLCAGLEREPCYVDVW